MADSPKVSIPKVSIIVPNYNSGGFIRNFIDSVRAQTYSNWELIIVDDKSTDDSPEIAEEYAKNDPRIKILNRTDDNKGACQRRNQGFRNSDGEFVCFFDSDDLLPEDTLEIRVKEMLAHPEADFVVVPAISFLHTPFDLKKLALGLPIFKDDLGMFLERFRLPFGVWTNIYRRSFLLKNNLEWDEDLTSLQDSDFNIRSLACGANYLYANNRIPGYYWRIDGNPDSITKKIKTSKNLNSQLYFYNKLLERFGEGVYRKAVERFGLTLLQRFALCQAEEMPEVLFSRRGRRWKYKALRTLYRHPAIAKFYPIVNAAFFPWEMLREYSFLIRNRIICRKYINRAEATMQDS